MNRCLLLVDCNRKLNGIFVQHQSQFIVGGMELFGSLGQEMMISPNS